MDEMIDTTTEVAVRDGGSVLQRPMTTADTDGVPAPIETLPPQDRPADPTASSDPPPAHTLVAARGEQVHGYTGYVASAPAAAPMSITVAPGFQGLGLGTLLLAELSARADAAGITRFTTETSAGNVESLHLLRIAASR